MKRLSFILILLSLSCTTLTATPRKVAVVIGIGDYPDSSGLQKLSADSDTTKLTSLLRNDGWTVYLINSYQDAGSQPNRQNILRALGIQESASGIHYGTSDRALLGVDSLSSDDTLLFFYGGHGWTGKSDEVNYILPRDLSKRTDGQGFEEKTLVSLNVVTEALRQTKAGSIIIVTDACRNTTPDLIQRGAGDESAPVWSGSVTASATRGKVYDPEINRQHLFILYSSHPKQPSYEMKDHKGGVFSFYLLTALSPDGMQQAYSKSKNCLTLMSLFQFTRSSTVDYVQGQLHLSQDPYMDADDPDWAQGFCIAQYVTPTPLAPPAPSLVGIAGTWSGEYTLLPNKGSRPTYIIFELSQNGATVWGKMTIRNEATSSLTQEMRGTYKENGDIDLTALPNGQSPVSMYFNGHLPNGASSLGGKVEAVDSRFQGKAQKKVTFPGIFSVTRTSQ